jgi:hypothetical protein
MFKLEVTRILKKLDGFSVLLAFTLSLAFQNFYSVVYELSARVTSWMGGSTDYFAYQGDRNWQDIYLNPIVSCVIWLVAIELTLQVAKYLKSQNKK